MVLSATVSPEDQDPDPITLKAARGLAWLVDRPWTALPDECRERAERHGITADELLMRLSAHLRWNRPKDG
ncbi:MAG: hypothetical protein JOZ41_07655 [Chloroflexi bacterium]|nr:hypothetical protein [Chloroflexota bacterium]